MSELARIERSSSASNDGEGDMNWAFDVETNVEGRVECSSAPET